MTPPPQRCYGCMIQLACTRVGCFYEPPCASHSSQQSEQCPYWRCTDNLKSDFRDQNFPRFYCSKQSEWDEVLDTLEKRVYYMDKGNRDFLHVEIKKLKIELRQQEQG